MKQLLLTLFLQGFFIGIAICQTYNPLIRPNIFWNENVGNTVTICRASSGSQLYFQGDTIINNIRYEILRSYRLYQFNSGAYCPPYAVDYSSSIPVAFMREDTVRRQVFVLQQSGFVTPNVNGEELLFDFSLNVGDTLHPNEGIIIDSVDSVLLLNGEIRKRFFVKKNRVLGSYIEGIGGTEGVRHHCFQLPIGSYTDPLCISNNGVNLYGTECNNIILNVVVEPTPTVSFELYPNPTQDYITVKFLPRFDHRETTISVINAQGQVIQEQESITDDTIMFSLLDYPAGVYLVQIRNSAGVVASQKIIIE